MRISGHPEQIAAERHFKKCDGARVLWCKADLAEIEIDLAHNRTDTATSLVALPTLGVAIKSFLVFAAVLSMPLLTQPAAAQGTIERLYVIECGERTAPDVAPWTPGVNIGKPVEFVDTCYLIKHGQDWMVWDTGVADGFFSAPAADASAWRRTKTLAGELEKLGVKPGDVKYVAISHTHPDHIGNVELFPQVTLLVQKAEYDWPNQDGTPRFKPSHPVTKIEGDHDVFGDGSATIISTPGHTPGHQSLLVKLPQTGVVLLSGDAVHLQDNWDAKRVPAINFDKEKSSASMQRMSELMEQHKAQLWINHDKPQSATMKHAPEFYR